MIEFKLTCKYDDKYLIKVNKKKIKNTKEKSQIFQYIDYKSELTNSNKYEIHIRRRFYICMLNMMFNFFNALGLGDRQYYSKINNKISITINNNMDINNGTIQVIANKKDDIMINDITATGSVSLN